MIADKMKNMVANSSAIRAMFEEGNRLALKYGAEEFTELRMYLISVWAIRTCRHRRP